MNQCPECEKPKYVKCCHNCKKDAVKCEVYHACGDDCPAWEEMTKTNADRIRAMSDEELEKFIQTIKTRAALCKAVKNNDAFKELCSAEWLQQPAE